jgi:hypothetical protein
VVVIGRPLALPSLEDHLAQLGSFLTTHAEEIANLKTHLASSISDARSPPSIKPACDRETEIPTTSVANAVDAHLRELQLFLHAHLENVQILRKSFDLSHRGLGDSFQPYVIGVHH